MHGHGQPGQQAVIAVFFQLRNNFFRRIVFVGTQRKIQNGYHKIGECQWQDQHPLGSCHEEQGDARHGKQRHQQGRQPQVAFLVRVFNAALLRMIQYVSGAHDKYLLPVIQGNSTPAQLKSVFH